MEFKGHFMARPHEGPGPGDRFHSDRSASLTIGAFWHVEDSDTALTDERREVTAGLGQLRSSRTLSRTSASGRKQKFNLRDYRLAEGISRSTWYRRGKAAREMAARDAAIASFDRALADAEGFAAALARDLERCAAPLFDPRRVRYGSADKSRASLLASNWNHSGFPRLPFVQMERIND